MHNLHEIENYTVEHKKMRLFDGAENVLDIFNKLGIKQTVISSTEQNSLLEQMNPFNINKYFTDILGINNHYAVSKSGLAVEFVTKREIDKSKVLFIGDTVHDYEVAQAAGCDCVLVANGHQSFDVLKTTPATIVNSIYDVPELILR